VGKTIAPDGIFKRPPIPKGALLLLMVLMKFFIFFLLVVI